MPCDGFSGIPSLYEILAKAADGEAEGEVDSPYTLDKFEKFMLKSHCEENYEFWKVCNGYLRRCNDVDFDVQRWNSRVYKRFIRENSPMECNLPTEIKEKFQESYICCGQLPRMTLRRARQHAWSLMTGAYRQYVSQVNNGTPLGGYASPRSVERIRKGPLSSSSSSSNLLVPAIELPTLITGQHSKSATNICTKGSDYGTRRSGTPDTPSPSRTPSSPERSPSESPDPLETGMQNLISKGKEFVSRFRNKHRRTSLASSSSRNSLYTRFEKRASDRTLYQK